MECRILSDVPKRLGVMEGNHAVILDVSVIPSCAVAHVGADKCCDVERGLSGDAGGDHISNDHVAVRLELLPVLVLDPLGETRRLPAWRETHQGKRAITSPR